jgi:hypothetical protein
MATWTRQQQEQKGSYFFDGSFYVTKGVKEELTDAEILSIYLNIKQCVKAENGIDYLQVFTDEAGRKLFFIDQLNAEHKASGGFKEEDNYCTLMFSNEY